MNKTRLSEAEAFLAVADRGGFGAAARELGVTQSTISRRIAGLEARIGHRLVQRTTRRVALTEVGRSYAGELREVLQRLDAAEARVQSHTAEPEGLLRLTMPTAFGRLCVLPRLARLAARYGKLRFELDLSDRYVDLLDGGFDLAIRLAAPPQSGVETRLLGLFVPRLCAAPAYAAANGLPGSPAEIAAHVCLAQRTYAPRASWRVSWKGRRIGLAYTPRMTISDTLGLHSLVLAGVGMAVLPSYVVEADLAAKRLIEVLPGLRFGDLEMFAAYPRHSGELSKVAVLLEELAQIFKPVAKARAGRNPR